jgi:hypothetical protein
MEPFTFKKVDDNIEVTLSVNMQTNLHLYTEPEDEERVFNVPLADLVHLTWTARTTCVELEGFVAEAKAVSRLGLTYRQYADAKGAESELVSDDQYDESEDLAALYMELANINSFISEARMLLANS